MVARGASLTRAADCEACHTAPDGRSFAGGRAFVLPFGALYSTNITPDRAAGIGGYTDAQFIAMMRHGVRPDGEGQIGSAHVCTPSTNAHLGCRRLLDKKTKTHQYD